MTAENKDWAKWAKPFTEEDEIGWDYIPFADDAIIDSWEREEIK